MKALLLGCGNIGSLYDWDTNEIKTYAKAFNELGVEFSVYDKDYERSKAVASRYNANHLRKWNEENAKNYDIAVISTPTSTHYEYLKDLLNCPPPLIICEKPVDTDHLRLNELEEKYKNSSAKVMVNFHRRFQPRIWDLAARLRELAAVDQCKTIVVNYQRGFHNNASHAIDVLSLLFGMPFDPLNARVLNCTFDEFEADPTISCSFFWNNIHVVFVGLVEAKFSHFEIFLYFSKSAISLRNGCDQVDFFSAASEDNSFYPPLQIVHRWQGVLKDHMLNVVKHAMSMVLDRKIEDNFTESVNISRAIMSILSKGA